MYATRPTYHFDMTEPEVDDEVLIERARTDVSAFEAIYTRYSVPVYRMCLRACGDPDTADDLTSVVFLKAFERLDQYRQRPVGTFRAWLFAITRNSILDHWRRGKRLAHMPDIMPELQDPDPGPEDIALSHMELADVSEVLSGLSDRYRSIIEFRLSGLTTREISDALGMSISAVKSAQTRAYANIRSQLQDKGAQS